MDVFGRYSKLYDLLYQDKDYPGETAFISSVLKRHAPQARTVLELGSGTGLHAQLLSEKGFHVTGIERSEGMVQQAVDRLRGASGVEILPCDIREVSLKKKFDAVISLFHVVSYLPEDSDIEKFFKVAAEHTAPGGLLFFDFWYGPAVLSLNPETRVKRFSNSELRVTRIAESDLMTDKNWVDVNYTLFIETLEHKKIESLRETHRMRYLFKREIDVWLERFGFEPLSFAEWMTDRPANEGTWGVYSLSRKRA